MRISCKLQAYCPYNPFVPLMAHRRSAPVRRLDLALVGCMRGL